jgi:hypothetical protein
MNKQLDQLTDVFISDEVLLMCHNLALLTEKEEVAALLIGQVSVPMQVFTIPSTNAST